MTVNNMSMPFQSANPNTEEKTPNKEKRANDISTATLRAMAEVMAAMLLVLNEGEPQEATLENVDKKVSAEIVDALRAIMAEHGLSGMTLEKTPPFCERYCQLFYV